MGINAQLRTESGEIVDEVSDSQMALSRATLSPPTGKSTTTTGITGAHETTGGGIDGPVRAPAVRVSAPGDLGVGVADAGLVFRRFGVRCGVLGLDISCRP